MAQGTRCASTRKDNKGTARREEMAAVKLPNITVEFREEESCALGRISITLILGMAAHIAWMYLFIFNGPRFFFPNLEEPGRLFFISSLVTFAITLLSYGIFLKQARTLFDSLEKRRRNRGIAAFLVFASMVIMLFANFTGIAPHTCSLVAGVTSGIGSAALLMSYGVSSSVCDLPTITISISIALFIAMVAFVLVTKISNTYPVVCILFTLLLPFAEVTCLKRCSHNLVDRLEFNGLTTPVHTIPFATHVCLPSIAFGIILGITRARVAHVPHDPLEYNDIILFALMAAIFALAIMLGSMLFQRKNNNFSFRTMLPVSALLLALLVIPACNQMPYATFFLFAAYIMMEGCMWIFYSDISQTYRVSAFTVFGFGRGSLALGALTSYLLEINNVPVYDSTNNVAAFIAFAFVLFSFGRSLLPTNAELRDTLKRGRMCPALISNDELALHDVVSMRKQAMRTIDDAQANVLKAGKAESGEEHPENKTGATPKPSTATAHDGAHKQGIFKRKCSLVAETYLLSRKETEVLFLLAKGHNSAAIQERLYISAGTANTHMRHIYRKLNVHSQQELMTLVESTWVEE